MLALAVGVTVAILAGLWALLDMPRISAVGPLKPADIYDAVKIALTVVAGVGGVVALVVAYRRQRLNEASEAREQGKAMTDRFGAAAEQLGADQSAVRMAGAYAMARLADDWPRQRQTCIDVLCGYLRMPHAPKAPEDEQTLAVWQREREVRQTVLRLIGGHLRDDAIESWRGHDLDFTGAVIDQADFRGARFTGGDIIFLNAVFTGYGREQVVFDDVEFAEGSSVYFRLAEFRGGHVRFDRAVFSGGWVTFDGARFTGAEVSFRQARFTGGEVRFEDAEFAGGIVDFTGATFTGSTVDFREHHLPTRYWTVPAARFSGGTVDFSRVDGFDQPPYFGLRTTPGGLKLPSGVDISDLE